MIAGRIGKLALAVTLFLIASSAFAQVQIKVNDQVNFKFGVLLQTQGDELEDSVAGGYAQNLFIRRARILFAGQVAPNVTFFAETDSPNMGKVNAGAKSMGQSIFLQDAYVDYKFSDAAMIDAGLLLVSASRNGLQSAASLLPIDYGAYTFSHSAPTQSTVGRDTGAQLRGYLGKGHFEYRAGVFQGARDPKSHNALRTTVRVQYDFLDPQGQGFFYSGTNLGKKKIFAIGGGADLQRSYHTYAADLFYDRPVNGKNAITVQANVIRFDGGTFLTTLPKQNDKLLEVGYYIDHLKMSPVIQYVKRDRAGTDISDESRTFVGANFWRAGHNANIKAGYTRIAPRVGAKSNEYTIQLQFFYF